MAYVHHSKEKILTLTLIIITLIFAVYLTFTLEIVNHKNDGIVIYNQTESNSCHINVIEPTIILRLDDVKAYSKLTKPLVDEILNRNISVTLGVIPKDLEKDGNIIEYLTKIKTNSYVEIAQHGTYHDESDKNITNKSLIEGYDKIQKILRVLPVTYIPPYNKISLESKKIISNYFKIISGERGIIKEGEKIAEIGYTEETYHFDKRQIVPIDEVIEKCKLSLDKNNLCIIAIHPQEYSTNIENPKTFDDFKKLLDELQNLNTKFSRFNDVVICSN